METREQIKGLLRSTNALLGAMRESMNSATGPHANVGKYGSFKLFMRKYNELAQTAAPLLPDTKMLDLFSLENIRGSSHYTWPQQKELFDSAYSNTSILRSLLESAVGYAEDEALNLRDFIQANLRRAIFSIPERETEIQNGIEALMVGRGMAKGTDYDRETGRVKTSGKSQSQISYSQTLGSQEKACRELCTERGWKVREVFRDAGVSGWADVERPAFKQMIGNIRENRDVNLVFFDYSRFGRKVRAALEAFETLDKLGVFSVAANNPGIDCRTAAGRTARRDELSRAEDFSDQQSEKTSAGMKAAFEDGRWCRPAPHERASQHRSL
jgi:DNA invertase Pin-like site-specific DNA recombinase